MSSNAEAVILGRRFQLVNSYHFNHQIKCVTPLGDSVAIHYTVGSAHVTSVHPLTPHRHPLNRVSSEKAVMHMLFVRKYRVYVMFCADLTLRVFTDNFQHIQTIPTTSTALCMEFVETTSTLYVGESGCIKVWNLRHQLHSPLFPLTDSTIHLRKHQWVIDLDYESERLTGATEHSIIIIDTNTHQQIATYTSDHSATITSAILFSSFGYLIMAFKDGSIKVLNTVLNLVIQDLSGHLKAVTALKRHPMKSSFLSCSLDGTVRVWDISSLTECNRVDLCSEVLGMTVTGCGCDTIQLVCHSHQEVKIWQLCQVESPFACINSHTVALRKVESLESSRIMATSEDGSVRLLSCSSGEVITIFFPIFTANVMSDVTYCPLGGLLFALLTTGDMLVLSAHTNPCSTIQHWTSQQRDKIESICICIVKWRRKTHTLLFGGGNLGYIFLLHSSHFTMTLPCPAHGGSINMLVSSDAPVVSCDVDNYTPQLLSFGSDNFLNVWSFVMNERGDHVELKMEICIQMQSVPRHIRMIETHLCITTSNNTVKILNISKSETFHNQNHCLTQQEYLFDNLPVLSHQDEDSHTDTITSLSCCPTLCLFATTSRDGHLKIWSSTNQLVAEIHFGESLVSACFSNEQGNLLVGFQRQICSVNATLYLPSSYLCQSTDYHHPGINVCEDRPIPFDPTLEFWYDPERVPTYTIQLEERSKHYCLLDDYYTRPPSEQQTDSREKLEGLKSEIMDVHLIRSDSHHLLASLVPSVTNITDASQLNKSGPSGETSLSSLQTAILEGLGAMRSQELLKALVDEKKSYRQRLTPVKRYPAYVMPLKTPSTKLPIAPDCHVPNSTIREVIGYVPSPDPLNLILEQQKLTEAIGHLLPTSPDGKLYYRRKNRQSHRMDATTGGQRFGSSDGMNDESSCDVLESESNNSEIEILNDGVMGEGGEISENGVNSSSSILCSLNDADDNEDCDGERSVSSLVKPSFQVVSSTTSNPSSSCNGDMMTVTHSYRERKSNTFSVKDKKDGMKNRPSVMNVENTVMQRGPSQDASLHRVDASPAKVVPTVTIPFRMRPPPPPPQTTVATNTTIISHATRHNTDSGGEGITIRDHQCLSGTDENEDLQRIMKIARFSSTLKEKTVGGVCDGIVSMLNSVNARGIGDISTAIVELKKVAVLTEAQQSDIADVLVVRLTSARDSPTRQATLLALERLGQPALNNTLQAILPSVLDQNLEVRKMAFSALKEIAGISSRSELHCKLIEMGILQHTHYNEDEILRGLSLRLNGQSRGLEDTRLTVTTLSGDTQKVRDEPIKRPSVNIQKVTHQQREQQRVGDTTSNKQRRSNTTRSRERRCVGGGSCKHPSYQHDIEIFRQRIKLQPIFISNNNKTRETGCSLSTITSLTIESGVSEQKKLKKLLATQPTTFSQSAPIREMMLGAYVTTTRDVAADRGLPDMTGGRGKTKQLNREFKWIDVFPIMRGSQREVRRARDNNQFSSLPAVLKSGGHPPTQEHTQLCFRHPGDTATTSTNIITVDDEACQDRDVELKLPKIMNT